MSRLDELINQYCPDGVEYRPLEQCCNILNNQRKPITKALRVAGNYPYYGANGIQDYVESYIFDGTFVLIGEDGSVQTADGRPVVTWAEGKIWVNNHAHIISEIADVNLRYIFHYLQTMNIAHLIHGNIPKLTGSDFKALEIPVPPLPVQEEIVRILDKFTELEQELEQELELRKKQYEYYRDKMLLNANGIEWVPIGELGDIIRGKRFVHKDDTECGVPAIHYGELYTHYGISAVNTKTHIRADLAPKMRYAHTGDVVIVGAGENKMDIGVGVAWMGDEDIAVHDACFILTNHVQNPKYISYCLRTEDYHRKLYPFISEGKICSFLKDGLAQVTLPIPKEREVQDKIVELLDKFSTLTSDISEGLPAEIKMRHKQYEYYRDKLLNFKRLEVV